MAERLARFSRHVSAAPAAVARSATATVISEHLADPYPAGSVPAGTIVIYGQPTSRVVKVLWMCAELGLSWVQVTGFAFRNEPWALALNPKGTVPFVRDGGLVLNESNSIVSYLCGKYGAGLGLYPPTPERLALAWQWMEFGETFLVPRTNPVFFGVVRSSFAPSLNRPGEIPSAEEIAAAVPGCQRAFEVLERRLAASEYLGGADFSMADVTCAIQANRLVGNDGFGQPGLALSRFPHVCAWHAKLCLRPAFAAEVKGRFK
jgi:glutathione S-transferase